MRDETTLSRREFLARSGATAAVIATGGLAGSSRAEGHNPHWAAKPDHVSIDYDQQAMERYAPRLVTYHLDFAPSALYGWRAASPEHETTAYVYFAKYPTQAGVGPWDSHLHDREPLYVFVGDDGSVSSVTYTAYHWHAASDSDPPLDGDRVRARPVNPHHHYTLVAESEDEFFADVPVESLVDTFDLWLSNGWRESLHPGAATNPWLMQSRESWWREKDWKDKVALALYDAYRVAGLAGADEADI